MARASIAIVKAKDGHTNYGEYSAVFPRETIDPQRSSKNKVYGGDAWTPTRSNARVEYEVDQSKARALEREIDRLSSEFAGGAFQNSSVIGAAGVNEETELSLDDIAERLAKYPAVQAAYLQSKGESLEPVYKEKKFDSLATTCCASISTAWACRKWHGFTRRWRRAAGSTKAH